SSQPAASSRSICVYRCSDSGICIQTPWLPGSLAVEGVQDTAVAVEDDLAANLHARRDQTVLDGQLVVEDREFLNGFPAIELADQPIDVILHGGPELVGSGDVGERGTAHGVLVCPGVDRVGVECDQRDTIATALPVDDQLADVRADALEGGVD